MTVSIHIPLRSARRLAVRCQLLNGSPRLPGGCEGAARVIEHLGYVQVDTIAVIERAHHHTLWTRRADYQPEHLHRLQTIERRVFEYWAHAASYVPTADYRFYLDRMERFRTPSGKWSIARHRACKKHFTPVLERIRAEGPLSSKDFESPARKGMWLRKPTTAALESLHLTGELMIAARRGFERVYDLTERVLPSGVNTTRPTPEERARFFVRRALQAYGIADEQDIVHHISGATREEIGAAVKDMVAGGELLSVQIAEIPGHRHYMLAETADHVSTLRAPSKKVSLLSPFDNLIIQRKRLKRLFDFDYTLECYVPAPKRVHGYFVLPILWGDQIVGRLDPKIDRKTGILHVKKVWLEEERGKAETIVPALATSLRAFARFAGGDKIRVGRCYPAALGGALKSTLSDYPNS